MLKRVALRKTKGLLRIPSRPEVRERKQSGCGTVEQSYNGARKIRKPFREVAFTPYF